MYQQRLEKAQQVARARASTRTATASAPSTWPARSPRSTPRTPPRSSRSVAPDATPSPAASSRSAASARPPSSSSATARGEIQVHVKKDALGDQLRALQALRPGRLRGRHRDALPHQDRRAHPAPPPSSCRSPRRCGRLPEKWHGLHGRRDPLPPALPRPGLQPRGEAGLPQAHQAGPLHPRVPRRARLRRGRDADDAPAGLRRGGAALQHPPQRARHRSLPAHRARAVPQAPGGGRLRARLRDQPQLPQRGHQHPAQPRVHDARVLPGVRHVRGPDGPHRGDDLRGGRRRVDRRTQGRLPGHTLDFGKGWQRIPMAEAIREAVPRADRQGHGGRRTGCATSCSRPPTPSRAPRHRDA